MDSAWIVENAGAVTALLSALIGLAIAVVYALHQMTRQITQLTGAMVTEVKAALGTATSDRQMELAFLQQYLSDSKVTREALVDAQAEVKVLAAEVSKLKVNMQTRRSEADAALTELAEARQDAKKAQSAYEAEKVALETKVTNMADEIQRLNARVGVLEESARLKQAALDEVTAERNKLRDELSMMAEQNAELARNNKTLRDEVAAMRRELDQLKKKKEAVNDDDAGDGGGAGGDAGGGADAAGGGDGSGDGDDGDGAVG